MRLNDAINIEDLHQMAKRRLPKVAFDFIEGGLEDERGLDRNTEAFKQHHLLPRYLVDVSKRDQSTDHLRPEIQQPVRHLADRQRRPFPPRRRHDAGRGGARGQHRLHPCRARRTRRSRTPPRSRRTTPGTSSMPRATPRSPRTSSVAPPMPGWTLVLTVDVPVHSKRERNTRNGYASIRGNWLRAALSLKPALLAEAMQHPGWIWEYITQWRHAAARQLAALSAARRLREDTVKFNRSMVPAHAQTWKELERYRKLFPRNLVVKGIMSPVRRDPLRRDRLRRHHRVEPRRAAARPGAGLARRAAGRQTRGRRPHDGDARQRRAARRRHPDRALPRRRFASSAGRPSTARSPAGSTGSRRRSIFSAARSTWSWARSARRTSTCSAPISSGRRTGSGTSNRIAAVSAAAGGTPALPQAIAGRIPPLTPWRSSRKPINIRLATLNATPTAKAGA